MIDRIDKNDLLEQPDEYKEKDKERMIQEKLSDNDNLDWRVGRIAL